MLQNFVKAIWLFILVAEKKRKWRKKHRCFIFRSFFPFLQNGLCCLTVSPCLSCCMIRNWSLHFTWLFYGNTKNAFFLVLWKANFYNVFPVKLLILNVVLLHCEDFQMLEFYSCGSRLFLKNLDLLPCNYWLTYLMLIPYFL